jgi:acyl-CoA synthetase (NDP forming)
MEVLMSSNRSNQLQKLFYPKSIAVVGASPKPRSRGNEWITAFIQQGYQGKIFPVHPTAKHILAYKAYPSIHDIPDDIDLVIFAIPFQAVLPVMKDCVEKGVKFVHLFTAGYSETGEQEHAEAEKELINIAKEGGVRLIGPNCMGVYCPEGGVSWMGAFPKTPGPVGFVSQSGQLASQLIMEGGLEGIRYSKVVSFGNASDLQCHDFLNYLAADDKTRIIGAYIEGLKDGWALFDSARNITRNKPMVVWKGGQTEGGARATQSHTASIAGSTKIWEAICKQTGIIQVHSMEDLISTTIGLLKSSFPDGNRVAIVGGAGGGSVTMTDTAEKEGLAVPHLSDETIQSLREMIPLSGNSVKNPLDIGFSTVYRNEEQFLRLYSLLRDDPNIDALIYSRGIFRRRGSGGRGDLDFLTQMTLKGIEIFGKPVLVVLESGKTLDWEALRQEAQARYQSAGIATFRSFQTASRVLFNLYQYKKFLDANNPQ